MIESSPGRWFGLMDRWCGDREYSALVRLLSQAVLTDCARHL